ncbi:MAG: hypothetical protein U0941_20035 [Planctomycetaceae bacterium]
MTTLAAGVDGTVGRLAQTYEVRGVKSTLTSWNDASVSSGDVVNEWSELFDAESDVA